MMEFRDLLEDAVLRIAGAVMAYAPRALAALGLLLLGALLGAAAGWFTRSLLKRLRVNRLLEKIGAGNVLDLDSVDLAKWVGRAVQWIVFLVFFQTAVEALGLYAVSDAVAAAAAYLPLLLSAVVVLVLGALVASGVRSLVAHAARSLGPAYARTLSRMAAGLVYLVTFSMTISQLRLETGSLQVVLVCLLAGISLGLGLSFALGSREVTRSLLAGFYARKVLRAGDQVEISGQRGTLVAITPTQAVIETRGSLKMVPNEAFLTTIVEKKTR